MTGPLLARVAPSDPAAWSTELVCMPVRANPPQDTAVKLWVNNRGSGGPSQAIPQRIYIFTMESFVHRATDRQNPLSRAPSANAWPLERAGTVPSQSPSPWRCDQWNGRRRLPGTRVRVVLRDGKG